MRLLFLLVPLMVVVFAVVTVAVVLEVRHRRTRALYAVVDQVRSLAWDHDTLDPALCGAVLERIRAVDLRPSAEAAQRALDDILVIAREHRETSPDLSVILIDTIRSAYRPGLS